MTKKMTLVVSFLTKIKSGMKLLTMLFLVGTILASTAPNLLAAGTASTNDLQQKRITGKVVDAEGNALGGVNVLEKGTLNGAITDANGSFSVNVASSSSILTLSFIGFSTQEVTVGDQTSLTITLKQALSALDEIVVVGYSTQTRKSLTGSVSTVGGAALQESAATNPITRLQGKVAGVTILNQHTLVKDQRSGSVV